MAAQSDAILSTTDATLAAQHLLADQQASLADQLEEGVVRISRTAQDIHISLVDLEGSQRQLAEAQRATSAEMEGAMNMLDFRTRQLSTGMDASLASHERLIGRQLEASSQMNELRALQSSATEQQREDLGRLADLARGHHSEAASWHEDMWGVQERLLLGQNRAADELAGLAGDLTEHHLASREWYQEVEDKQRQLALGSSAMLAAQVGMR